MQWDVMILEDLSVLLICFSYLKLYFLFIYFFNRDDKLMFATLTWPVRHNLIPKFWSTDGGDENISVSWGLMQK